MSGHKLAGKLRAMTDYQLSGRAKFHLLVDVLIGRLERAAMSGKDSLSFSLEVDEYRGISSHVIKMVEDYFTEQGLRVTVNGPIEIIFKW